MLLRSTFCLKLVHHHLWIQAQETSGWFQNRPAFSVAVGAKNAVYEYIFCERMYQEEGAFKVDCDHHSIGVVRWLLVSDYGFHSIWKYFFHGALNSSGWSFSLFIYIFIYLYNYLGIYLFICLCFFFWLSSRAWKACKKVLQSVVPCVSASDHVAWSFNLLAWSKPCIRHNWAFALQQCCPVVEVRLRKKESRTKSQKT